MLEKKTAGTLDRACVSTRKKNLMNDKQEARLKRAQERRRHIVVHRAANHEEAEEWDLAYWQDRTPHERLSALLDLHADIEKVEQARRYHEQHS